MADKPPRAEDLGPGFGCISISFATEDRGKVGFLWHVTREVADQWLAEFRERMGDAHQESIATAEMIDAATAAMFKMPGLMWVDHAQADAGG